MPSPFPFSPEDQVNLQALELMQDFRGHYQEMIEIDPKKNDVNLVFQGWAIQKIAGLQLAVLELTQRLNQRARVPISAKRRLKKL